MDLPDLVSINESFYPHEGGAERRAFETLTRLAKKGFSVKVITNPFPDHTELPGIDIEYITDLKESQYFKKGSRKISGVRKFASSAKARLSKNNDGDIYMFDEFPLLPALKGVSVLPENKPKFFTWHEVLGDFYRSKGLLWKMAARWEKKLAQSFNNNIAVSKTVASIIEASYNPSNISVIENGVNVKEYLSRKDREWGKIIYVGRLEPHKRVEQLVSQVLKSPEIELDIIGFGSQYSKLKHLCDKASNIKLYGHLPKEEIVDRLKRSWLFAMPSAREGFSIASLEAMAASVPVITVDGQYNLAANEIIHDGKNGIIAKNFEDMGTKISSLYKDEDTWSKLSNNAYNFSLKYDWDVISEKLSKTISSSW